MDGCQPSDYRGLINESLIRGNGVIDVLYERCRKNVGMTLTAQTLGDVHKAAGMQKGSVAIVNPESFELVFGKDGEFEDTVHMLGTTSSAPVLQVAHQALGEAEASAAWLKDDTHPDGKQALAAAKTALGMVNCRLKYASQSPNP